MRDALNEQLLGGQQATDMMQVYQQQALAQNVWNITAGAAANNVGPVTINGFGTYQPPQPLPPSVPLDGHPADCEEVRWLKKRVREIEWRL